MLEVKTRTYPKKDGTQGSIKEMKIQGKLMSDDEKVTLVNLVDKGLKVKTIPFTDKKTKEKKTFEVGEMFVCKANDETENNGFTAKFSGQALKEMKKFIGGKEETGTDKWGNEWRYYALEPGKHFTIIKDVFTLKKTGAMFPIVKILNEEQVTAGTTNASKEELSQASDIISKALEEDIVDVKYDYTEVEEKLIKAVKEKNEGLETLMFNLRKIQGSNPGSVKDLDEERFKVRLK